MILSTIPAAIGAFAARLRFPQLFMLTAGLFLLDVLIPDLIPFVDEALLALLTVLLGMWQQKTQPPAGGPPMNAAKPPMKDVTPPRTDIEP